MPDPLTLPVLTRRAVLVGLAAGITAGCTGSSSSPRASGSTTPTPTPSTSQTTGGGGPSSGGPLPADAAVRRAAIAREQSLAGRAAGVLAAHPTLASVRMAAAFPTAHIEALAETLPSAVASPSTSPTAGTHQPKSTKSLASALRVAAAAHREAATTSSADLARLLSSIAASDSALAAALQL